MRFTEDNKVINDETYRAILVGLQLGEDITHSMDELRALAEAANVEVVGNIIQKKERPDRATFIGKGKVEELLELCENMEVDTLIFNDELSGMQIRNLEERAGVKVIDRTILILDIFASRAVSKEGKLQIELAQLQYRAARLIGFGKSLSQQGGGIGTRGPGEKKLEIDRRHISTRIDDIKKEVKEVESNRSTQRAKRKKNQIPIVALVGYTNSGKSATMNRLLEITKGEEKSVTEKDMLFATLDTFQRLIKFQDNKEFILVDTVGFVSKLPHALVKAFKGTLEEVREADLLLHIVDSTYENFDFHINIVNNVLKELGADNKDTIMVYNKIDRLDHPRNILGNGRDSIEISAKYDQNVDILIEKIKEELFGEYMTVKFLIPYSRGDITSYLCEKTSVINQEHVEAGTIIETNLSNKDYQKYIEYLITE